MGVPIDGRTVREFVFLGDGHRAAPGYEVPLDVFAFGMLANLAVLLVAADAWLLFLPSEEDQPSLGEDPNPEPEPTPVAEIPAPREYATPEEVKHFLARARRVLAPSPEKLRDMPSPSKCIH
jgi:hypothetical protein